MMKKLLPKHQLLLIALCYFSLPAFSQGGEVRGVTLSGVKPVAVNLTDVLNYQNQHPVPPDFVAELRPELDGPIAHELLNSPKVAKGGSLVPNSSLNTSTVSSSSSLAPGSSFLTIWGSYARVSGRESPYTPPDNCGDVGPTQIIATANCRMKVFNKPTGSTSTGSSTTTLSAALNVDLNAFFTNPARGISSISDPHVRYDRFSGRWFIVAVDVNHTTNNYCCLAVSKGSTISAGSDFDIYYFNVSQTGGSSRDFFDYPTLGVDNHFLNIGGNMFKSQRMYSGSTMWVVDKNALVNNNTLTVTGFPQNLTHTDMYTPQGVQNNDAGASNGYFIGASQSYYSKINIRKVNYNGSSAPTLSGDLSLTSLSMYTPSAVQTKGGTSIDGGDRRPFAAMIRNNSLWVAQGTKLDVNGNGGSAGDRDGALWLQIDVSGSTPSILQEATFSDRTNTSSSSAYSYIYPTIATSGQGHSFMGFTSAGASYYASAAATNRFRTDEVATMRPATILTNATSTYNPGASRWGDFTQTVVDPNDDMTMWTFTEYVPTTDAWGVRAVQLPAPPPATPSVSSVCGSQANITITGTSTNNSEFYDGGPSFAKRLQVNVSGGVQVTNVTFTDATHISADLNFPTTQSGTYSLTVINPDGQAASCNFNYTGSCPALTSSGRTVDQPLSREFMMKVFPNPARSQVMLHISSPEAQAGSVELFDNLGRLVSRQAMNVMAGITEKTISLTNLPAGSYLIQYRDTQQKILKKEQIIKE